jgi:Cft2 family RNA processing exonuclease
MAAEIPSTSPDVLIVESTYGVQVYALNAISFIITVVNEGASVVIPLLLLLLPLVLLLPLLVL